MEEMELLREWFLDKKRDLPWREMRTPYRVWISEVMLQQTQVSVVIPYFLRWMQKFPTLPILAETPIEQIIKMWEGLGYYQRARNLHKAAQIIVTEYNGEFPGEKEELEKLPGFGSYTVGAVLSFAFQKKAAAVDGNVLRVLSRLYGVDKDPSHRKYYERLALSILPDLEPWIVMEGLIELGAQVCQKKPRCFECPLSGKCQTFKEGRVAEFPPLKVRPKTIHLKRQVAIIRWKEDILVRQEKEGKVMAGLYEFPYVSLEEEFAFDFSCKAIAKLEVIKHGFTKYNVQLYPCIYEAFEKKTVDGFEWRKWSELSMLPFSSGHRRILELLIHGPYFTH